MNRHPTGNQWLSLGCSQRLVPPTVETEPSCSEVKRSDEQREQEVTAGSDLFSVMFQPRDSLVKEAVFLRSRLNTEKLRLPETREEVEVSDVVEE